MIEFKDITLVDITKLKHYKKNRNKHDKNQIDRLAQLIKEHGFRDPLTVDVETNEVITGNGTLMAAKKLEMKEIPVIYQKFKSEEQKYSFSVSHNAINKWSEIDLSKIHMDLSDLAPFDIDLLGIKDFQFEPLAGLSVQGQDDIPEPPKVAKSRLGDLWLLGDHRLLCGDSTDLATVERLMNGEKADMVFTDPPYGISYQSNRRTKSAKFDVIDNDESFLTEWIQVLPIVSQGWVFVWTTWKVLEKWIEITKPIGEMTNLVVWDKGGGGIGDLSKTFSTDHELALVFNRSAEITGKRLGSVWSTGKDGSSEYLHPTQKPVELGQTALENCTNPKDRVLDLFGVSGSTLIACEKTKRRCYMMELDPIYIDVIISRWCQFTGKEAYRESDKKTWSELSR